MGKSSKAPSYQAASYNTGNLFGSSTTDKSGTTFNPEGWQTNTMNTVGSALPNTLNSMLSGDFANDPNFRIYQNDLNRQMRQAFDANVLGQIANKNLMRSSGLQAATNSFDDTLANNVANLYDNYYNRQANNLNSLMNVSSNIYNQLMGVNQGSQSQANAYNNYNLNKYKAEQEAQAARLQLYGQLANATANVATGGRGAK